MTYGSESSSEALSYFPDLDQFHVEPESYLQHIRRAKEAVKIPIVASLNATSLNGWTDFAALIEQAGADALELNIYYIPTDPHLSGADVEQTYIDIVQTVKQSIKLPVAVKLSPYFSNTANMAKRLDVAGANALVLFNRFYQPDIDLETLEVYPHVLLSTPQAMRLPLRWIAILYGRIRANLAATSGVHSAEAALKLIMAGADVTKMASILLRIPYLQTVEKELREWMEVHEYESVTQMRGSMSQVNCADPSAFERAQYMKALTTYSSLKGN